MKNLTTTDPMQDATWTLPQAIAWIALRDPGAMPPPGKQVDSGRIEATTFNVVSLQIDHVEEEPRLFFHDAYRELWHALTHGRLVAKGLPDRPGGPVNVPADEWNFLEADDSSLTENVVRSEQMRVEYRDAFVPRGDVVMLWPAQDREALPSASSFADDDARMIEKMHDLLTTKSVKSVSNAARVVAPEAKRNGTIESVVERLRRAYAKEHPRPKPLRVW